MKQKVICQDCGLDLGYEAEWGDKGNPLSADCLLQTCDACESIRIGLGLCISCKAKLTAENYRESDGMLCSECSEKWNALPYVEIPCPACGTNLEQDHENLAELWCPKCVKRMLTFVQVDKANFVRLDGDE